jgi:hypothetical protein
MNTDTPNTSRPYPTGWNAQTVPRAASLLEYLSCRNTAISLNSETAVAVISTILRRESHWQSRVLRIDRP